MSHSLNDDVHCTSAPLEKKHPKGKTIAAITIGNGLEFYDFTIFSFFATIIGKHFFPTESAGTSLLMAFATYGVGFIMRPLGSLFLGQYADKHGRKAALTLTLWLMAIGSAIFVLAPTYQNIGIYAPILIVIARLLQGFAIGGELGASTSYLMEFATKNSRGYYSSWQFFSQGLSVLMGALVGLGLTALLTTEQLNGWGWRIPFIIGLLVIPVGQYIRNTLPEQHTPAKEQASLWTMAVRHKISLIAGILISIGGTSANYVILHYMANYAISQLNVGMANGIFLGCVAGFIQICFCGLAGKICDRFGYKKMVLITRVMMLIAIYPAFLLIENFPVAPVMAAVIVLLTILLIFNTVPSLVLLGTIFPREFRATGLSFTYSISTVIFGGFAQFFCSLLIKMTGNNSAPAMYILVCGLISLLGLFLAKEKE
ncbi:MFS transporter [Klebsiella pneumoniae]|uniref:MFS transporter n=1 Tax=Klebsiella pneumoniae complex TaxID=3390273 RepID=UPI000B411F4A|nr:MULTISPECIES: MFS transporter [Klebsiella]HCM6144176.1 MFS transporter [Klebsiella aerogenes]MDH2712373.1 MFS transporter [Klebsiella quasipneumoniae]OVX06169.1 MFS transporter [Klebsiella pneumoniae]QLS62915.1 MFS transporter [Klebsiella variicola]TAH98352.1 MFS transporter [Klebsiella pneumoniae]